MDETILEMTKLMYKEARQTSIKKWNKQICRRQRIKDHIIKISVWNVKILLAPEKMQEAENELKRYQVDTVGLQEISWSGWGNWQGRICYSETALLVQNSLKETHAI